MRKLILVISIFFFVLHVNSQKDFITDSLKLVRPKLVRPQFKFDNRVTFYEGQSLFIRGYDAGVLLANKLRIALGYSSVQADLNAFRQTIDSVDVGRLVKVNYGSINIEFNYLDTRFFTLGMPLELAGGWNALKFKNFTNDQIYRSEAGVLILSHFGLSGTFKPIRWFGLKGTVGYRQMLYSQVKDFNFGGFFTSIGFNVDFREIISDIRMFNLMRRHKRGDYVRRGVDLITD